MNYKTYFTPKSIFHLKNLAISNVSGVSRSNNLLKSLNITLEEIYAFVYNVYQRDRKTKIIDQCFMKLFGEVVFRDSQILKDIKNDSRF